jgi:gliding motility-associated-like protein
MRFAIAVFLFFYWNNTFAQVNNEANIGFEQGNMSGWKLSSGNVRETNGKVDFFNETNGIIPSRAMIVSKSSGNDDKIFIENIPKSYPKSNYSLQIGNTTAGNTFQKAETSFLVNANHSMLQFHFAVLLLEDERSNHSVIQKPGFRVNITELNGTPIPCGDFNVQLEKTVLKGFKKQDYIEYRNWSTGSIDLRKHLGKLLKIEVIVHGCLRFGHFGYAYFDAELLKTEIQRTSACPDANGKMIFLAPEGFEKYEWDNGGTERTGKYTPSANQNISVKVTPFSVLDQACAAEIKYTLPYKNVSNNIQKELCEGEKFVIDNQAYSTTGNFTRTISRNGICDSIINLSLKIIPSPKINISEIKCDGEKVKIGDTTINTTGFYQIKIKRPAKCDSLVWADLTFEKFEIKTPADFSITEGDSIPLSYTILKGNSGQDIWLLGNGNQICSNCNNTIVSPSKSETYIVNATSLSGLCKREAKMKIEVRACTLYFPDIFSPNNDGINDVFFGKAGNCIKEIASLEIYNRWGNLIFLKNNFAASDPSMGWNGIYKERFSMTGTYIYKTTVVRKNGEIYRWQGKFNLTY